MQQKKTIINVLILLLVIGAIILGYFYLRPAVTDEQIGLSSPATTADTAVSAETSEFLILLESLQSVDLNGQIFQNKIFASELVNFTTEITRRPQGRSNPFATIGTNNLADQPVVEEETPAGGDETSADNFAE